MNVPVPAKIAKRDFLVPAALAFSAHAMLLLGFTDSHLPKIPPVPPQRPYKLATLQSVELPSEKMESEPSPTVDPVSKSEKLCRPDEESTVSPISFQKIATGPIDMPTIKLPMGEGEITGGKGPGSLVAGGDKLDNPPRTIAQPAPVYPFEARRGGLHGRVLVEFVVDESGHVVNPHVLSSTNTIFEEPTLRAIEQWRFIPGTIKGMPVRFHMSIPVTFDLNG